MGLRVSDVDVYWLMDRLEGVEWDESSKTGMAYCPCHDDIGSAHKGLSFAVKGKKLVGKCWSPHCAVTMSAVVQQLAGGGREEKNAIIVHLNAHSNGPGGLQWWTKKTGVPLHIWKSLGVESNGKGVKFTFDGKQFYKYRDPPKDFGWSEALGAETPPLWPLPDDHLPEQVTITVGESDCGTAHFAGLPYAFCCTKGDDTPLSKSHFEALADRGVTSVLLISDCDDSGLKARETLEKAAVDADLHVQVVELERVVDPFSGIKDLNGVWRAVEGREHFHQLIRKATRDARDFDPRMTLQEIDDLLADEEYFYLPGLISPLDKIMVVGPQKSYKTWILLDLVRAFAACKPFMNRDIWTPANPLNVLFIEEEGSRRAWAKRLNRMGLTEEEFSRVHAWHRRGFTFTSEEAVASVIAYMKQHDIECVIFDPLQRMIPGIDENSASDTAIVWDQIMRMQNAVPTLTSIVTHHSSKDSAMTWEGFRGSSRHAAEVDGAFFLQKHPLEANRLRMRIDGRDIHTEMAPGDVFEAGVNIADDSFLIDAADYKVNVRQVKMDHVQNAVLAAVRAGHQKKTDIKNAAGISENTLNKYLQILISEGLVTEEIQGAGKPNFYNAVEHA